MASVFAKYRPQAWPHRYAGTLVAVNLHGGVPRDPKTVEGWLRTKVKEKDAITEQVIKELMAERGIIDVEEGVNLAAQEKVNGFYRDEEGLYIPGNSLKACLKEGASVAANEQKIPLKNWGTEPSAKKWLKNWLPEHVFVMEDRLHLGVKNFDDIDQRFTHSQYGASITREEVVFKAEINFTIETDHAFTEEQWALIWLTAEQQGLGASRSQGFGRFEVTQWRKLPV